MFKRRLFNAHSHRKPTGPREWVCRNAFHFLNKESIEALPYPVSVGLHPWFAESLNSTLENQLRSLPDNRNVVALGEVGLDKARSVDWKKQMEAFEFQFELSQEKRLPLILHCVKAYYDLIPFCKKSKVPVLFHGFRGNKDILSRLSEIDTVFFSFGTDLINHSGVQGIIRETPVDRILLETDSSPVSIERIYLEAARLLALPGAELEVLIKKNSSAFFGERALADY
jgi:TatD DNase family protein